MLPVRGEVGRVAEAVCSHGENDDAQELQSIVVVVVMIGLVIILDL